MKKSHLSDQLVQYVETFRVKTNVSLRPHRLTDKNIAKILFVCGLNPEIIHEEIVSMPFDNFDDVIREAREEYLP